MSKRVSWGQVLKSGAGEWLGGIGIKDGSDMTEELVIKCKYRAKEFDKLDSLLEHQVRGCN